MLDKLTRSRLGFMQGRLSPIVNGRIQSFPWDTWELEFEDASTLGFHLMEWTLDHENLMKNPLMTQEGRNIIRQLMESSKIKISSLTGDCFMQAPFWKKQGLERDLLLHNFRDIADACHKININLIVIPLVDDGSLENLRQESDLIACLIDMQVFFLERNIRIAFESDYPPSELTRFINCLDPQLFGINYDIGNSASAGFDPKEEISSYGLRVMNVHIKDRVLGGGTVPLGSGSADFPTVFRSLGEVGYDGNFILQTARAADSNHSGALIKYQKMALSWIEKYAT